MKCYRKCQDTTCDELKMRYCIDYISEKEYEYRREIKDSTLCNNCFSQTVDAIYNHKQIRLCTNCNNVLRQMRDKG